MKDYVEKFNSIKSNTEEIKNITETKKKQLISLLNTNESDLKEMQLLLKKSKKELHELYINEETDPDNMLLYLLPLLLILVIAIGIVTIRVSLLGIPLTTVVASFLIMEEYKPVKNLINYLKKKSSIKKQQKDIKLLKGKNKEIELQLEQIENLEEYSTMLVEYLEEINNSVVPNYELLDEKYKEFNRLYKEVQSKNGEKNNSSIEMEELLLSKQSKEKQIKK